MRTAARMAMPAAVLLDSDRAQETAPDAITRMLTAIRAHLGMDVAFASEIRNGDVIIRHADTVPDAPIQVGDSFPTEAGYCQRIIDGRLPELIPDTSKVPEAAALECTAAIPVGAHLSVPLRLSDGSIYGTFCCFSFDANPTLNERDLRMLRTFADLVAAEIDADRREDRERQEKTFRIAQVVAKSQIGIVYQPIHRFEDGRIKGVECLARFADCEARGPEVWFAEAAEAGLGVELELVAVRAALLGHSYLPHDIYLTINVSPATVLSGKLEPILAAFPAGRVVIEITEHSEVKDYEELADALEPLRRLSALAIDDVGAGYSGMRHILDLKPDLIKLDMSLVRDIDTDPARRALALALTAFASGIDCQVIAEGVETAGELAALRELGVHMAQGYYLARPMPLIAVRKFLLGDRD